MKNRIPTTLLTQFSDTALVFIAMSTLLSGCDSGSKSPNSGPTASQTSANAVTFHGQVRDDNGLFKSGNITATNFKGKQVARAQWEDNIEYSIEIPAGTGFPVLLTAKTKHKGSKSQKLVAAVISPSLTKHDITPNSTIVAKKAKSLGGYTSQNMMQATLNTVNKPKGDRSVEGFRGDPTKQFGGWH